MLLQKNITWLINYADGIQMNILWSHQLTCYWTWHLKNKCLKNAKCTGRMHLERANSRLPCPATQSKCFFIELQHSYRWGPIMLLIWCLLRSTNIFSFNKWSHLLFFFACIHLSNIQWKLGWFTRVFCPNSEVKPQVSTISVS